jgi:general secretion pathway protein I
MRARAGTGGGFTLIEVLVAFLILAFSLGALFSLYSGSLSSVRQGEDYAHATALARSQLARLDADGIAGQGVETGETVDGYRWRIEFAPLPEQAARSGDGAFEPLVVIVNVSWGALDNRSVSLSTVRLARR